MTNLQKRILATCIYFPALLLSAFDYRIFALVVTLLLGLSWHEYLSFKSAPIHFRDWLVHFSIILFGSLTTLFIALAYPLELAFAWVGLALMGYIIWQITRHASFVAITHTLGFYILGFIYLTGLYTALALIRERSLSGEAVWFLFFVVGATDTGAYFAGRKYGKTPFFQHISPSKTLEGVWGGLAAAGLASILFYFLFSYLHFSTPPLLVCLILGLIVGAAGVWGDLFESMLKRQYGVKDSGRLIPGHGGVLDRFDAVMFAALPLFFFVILRGGFR